MTEPISSIIEVPITFDAPEGALHCPMVTVTVNGTSTKLILDTGSTDHVLTKALATRAGMKLEPAEPGTDLSGASVPSSSPGEVSVQIGDNDLRLCDVVVIEGPARFEDWGVGGFLSPQHLHPSALVMLDLAEDRLTLLEADVSAVARWLRSRFPGLHLLTLEREAGDTVIVRASIEPSDGVETMLDTGSNGTEFARVSVPGLRGVASGSTGLRVGGADIQGEEVKEQILRVGRVAFPLPTLVVREFKPPPHGLIGMDVLRGTVVVVGADQGQPVHWLVPARPGTATR